VSEDKRRDDPVILDFAQRLSRLEARVDGIERSIDYVKEKVKALELSVMRMDNKLWYVITGVALTILLQILLRLVP
jgi:uncharacterized coiled-coil protein SlyX